MKENMRLQIEAREKMQAELNKQEEQKKLEAKQAEQMALTAAKAVESLFAIPICHTCQSNRNALGLVTKRKNEMRERMKSETAVLPKFIVTKPLLCHPIKIYAVSRPASKDWH